MKMGRRISVRVVRKTVSTMQYRENRAMMMPMTRLGVPSQMRVLDSRSYLRIRASTSAAVPTDVSCCSWAAWVSCSCTSSFCFLKNAISRVLSFSWNSGVRGKRGPL